MASVRHRAFLAIACASLLAPLGACLSPSAADGKHNPPLPAATSSALLRSGDSLIVTLQGVPDPPPPPLQIDEQGFVTLPYIGAVKAAGMGPAELRQRIRETYLAKKIYKELEVSVTVTERFVYVGGEVQHPGRVVWTADLTLAKAIQSAGGFSLYAKDSAVQLVRDGKTYAIDAGLAQRTPAEDPALTPGDALQVPRSAF
jgi:polysaccharide export outer membrane protein